MDLILLKAKFNSILGRLNSHPTVNFCNKVEAAFEALTMARMMQEYARIHGGVVSIVHPTSSAFLNQKPGTFKRSRAFEVTFTSGDVYYFATDVEVWGLNAREADRPMGIKFEADVVVIRSQYTAEIHKRFSNYPAPQHLDCVCECKFGEYNKGQLRELLGLRRHISILINRDTNTVFEPSALFSFRINNASPVVAIFMARPRNLAFFDIASAALYDLRQ